MSEPAKKGKLYVVGVGPGSHDHMTYRAKQVIEESEVIVGYETYVGLVEDLIQGKEVYRYAMTQEVDRANQAIGFAEKGRIVSLVSSGDPGIYAVFFSEIGDSRVREYSSIFEDVDGKSNSPDYYQMIIIQWENWRQKQLNRRSTGGAEP